MTDLTIGDAPATDATVRLAAGGDEAAFARLVERHHGSMAKVAYAVCGDPEGAREATQSAWAIAWRRDPTLRDQSQVRAWLVAIAANEARQAIRGRGRAPCRRRERLDPSGPGGALHPLAAGGTAVRRPAVAGGTRRLAVGRALTREVMVRHAQQRGSP